jgi:hypothetical protein
MRALTRGMHAHRTAWVASSHMCRMIRDDRIQQEELRTIFDVKEAPNKLG